jgi:enoyl-[acyl-carrier-protein] reductase (NADH)
MPRSGGNQLLSLEGKVAVVTGSGYEDFVAHRGEQVPMDRMGDAWDVAHAALFLASDEARDVTATELVVAGNSSRGTK